jgi:hypothetical protein
MALDSEILEFPFTAGQNEGTDRTVLPVGQFSYLQNARYRRTQKLGKRNGYTSLTSLDSSGQPMGSGGGVLACLGPEFCVVDDRLYIRDESAGSWRSNKPTSGFVAPRLQRILPDRFPLFTPRPIIRTAETSSASQLVNASSAYTMGYVWAAQTTLFYDASYPSNTSWRTHIEAIDPETGRTIFATDETLGSAASTDVPQLQLFAQTDGSLAVVTDNFSAGVKDFLTVYRIPSIAAGLGSGFSVACEQYAVAKYAAQPNALLVAYATANTLNVGWVNTLTGVVTVLNTLVHYAAVTKLSVFEAANGEICIGYDSNAGFDVRCRLLTSAGVVINDVSVKAILADITAPILFVDGATGSARRYRMVGLWKTGVACLDADVTGAMFVDYVIQANLFWSSQPFTSGGRVFIWGTFYANTGLNRYALLRIPSLEEYQYSTDPGPFPLQATVDNLDATSLNSQLGNTSGTTLPTVTSTPLGLTAILGDVASTYITAGGIQYRRTFALVSVSRASDGARYAPSCVVPVAQGQFIPAAQPMFVRSFGATEAGFVALPGSDGTLTASAGGSLTPSSAYSYTAVYVADGERSAPAVPVTVTLTAGQSRVTVGFLVSDVGYKRGVTVQLYRTAANGSQFYFLTEIAYSPGDAPPIMWLASATGFASLLFVDTTADSVIIQNEVLYTQIGQELAAERAPACMFANVGGDRLWCGGGFEPAVVTASKTFIRRLLPEFADDDAFRVTLPSPCTGLAWCDGQVAFTQDGIYLISGDGPDVAGVGDFTVRRLPFSIGCIDWRSIAVCDIGVFFQSPRGLHLLPRGFAAPVAMDQVLSTLETYPVITSARSDYNSSGGADNSEQLVQWTAVADEAATSGVVITFDVPYSSFSVDTYGADFPATLQSGWQGNAVLAPSTTTVGASGASKWHPFRVRDSSYDDSGLAIEMRGVTGDVRPWGPMGHGVVNRVGLLAELRSAASVEIQVTTDRGVGVSNARVYTGVAPDLVAGDTAYLEAPLGNVEQRDVTATRVAFRESSTNEGVAIFGLSIEKQAQNQGWRLQAPRDRIGS